MKYVRLTRFTSYASYLKLVTISDFVRVPIRVAVRILDVLEECLRTRGNEITGV